MPRTKQVKTKDSIRATESHKLEDSQLAMINEKKRQLNVKIATLRDKVEEARAAFKSSMKQTRLSIPAAIRSKTIGEMMDGGSTFLESLTLNNFSLAYDRLNSKAGSKTSKDDGYSTSDSATAVSTSSAGSSTRRSSRTTGRSDCANHLAVQTIKHTRKYSRSLPRNKGLESSTTKQMKEIATSTKRSSSANRYKTPVNTKKLESYGTVTPKVNPNKPQVLLRRPAQGEMAISLQGSPLLTTAMVTETTANVNIPLPDGRLMNLQPMRGLRVSELPELDPEIRRQLMMLKENIEKVCGDNN